MRKSIQLQPLEIFKIYYGKIFIPVTIHALRRDSLQFGNSPNISISSLVFCLNHKRSIERFELEHTFPPVRPNSPEIDDNVVCRFFWSKSTKILSNNLSCNCSNKICYVFLSSFYVIIFTRGAFTLRCVRHNKAM